MGYSAGMRRFKDRPVIKTRPCRNTRCGKAPHGEFRPFDDLIMLFTHEDDLPIWTMFTKIHESFHWLYKDILSASEVLMPHHEIPCEQHASRMAVQVMEKLGIPRYKLVEAVLQLPIRFRHTRNLLFELGLDTEFDEC